VIGRNSSANQNLAMKKIDQSDFSNDKNQLIRWQYVGEATNQVRVVEGD
jgi:hypothetical protein